MFYVAIQLYNFCIFYISTIYMPTSLKLVGCISVSSVDALNGNPSLTYKSATSIPHSDQGSRKS